MEKNIEMLLVDSIWLFFHGNTPTAAYSLAQTINTFLCDRCSSTVSCSPQFLDRSKLTITSELTEFDPVLSRGDLKKSSMAAQFQIKLACQNVCSSIGSDEPSIFLFKMWFYGANPDLVLPDHKDRYFCSQHFFPNIVVLEPAQKLKYGLEVLNVAAERPDIILPLIDKVHPQINRN